MRKQLLKWVALGLVLMGGIALLAYAARSPLEEVSAAPPDEGIICTYGPTFTLTTTDGYIGTPDDNVVYMWGYAADNSPFQHPSPVLCVNEGDTVTVILHNTLPDDVSIMFPGQENVLANGQPAQPQFDGGGNLTSLTNVAAGNGGSITYSFVADKPGTFLYESGTEPDVQVRMGLFGALIVRPAMGADHAYNRSDSQFNPDTEFMVLLSEVDPFMNQAMERHVQRNRPFIYNIENYRPRYWLVNGRGFPDSIAPNFAAWLPSQPYGALARIHPYDPVDNPVPAMARYLNVGTTEFPFHPHGNNGRVIGRDGHPLEGTGGEDLSFEKFSINLGPGQTWDVIFKWYDAEGYSPDNPVPVTVPGIQNLVFGLFYSGSPYLGEQGTLPVGTSNTNSCGEYYIISHNHALYQITSWGVPMTGPITYMRIDPPLPNDCP
ncbi:MAG: multicopper oxidase domain-containing protein [Ardenticatenaceae bacterium]|nr:multicopper oxidase domain-containing protein [Ardenticatenaceae bacterium]